MNNQEKFTTRASTLKVHRSNSQTKSSYLFRFFTDILFSFLVSFAFCLLALVFFKLKIFILIHIRLCGRVSDKKIFTRPISGNQNTFFGFVDHFLINSYNFGFLPFFRETFIFTAVSKENFLKVLRLEKHIIHHSNRYFIVSMSLVWIHRLNILDNIIFTEFKSKSFCSVSNVIFGGRELLLPIVVHC